MIDMNRVRELTAELAFMPATTDEADIELAAQQERRLLAGPLIDSITCAGSASVGDRSRCLSVGSRFGNCLYSFVSAARSAHARSEHPVAARFAQGAGTAGRSADEAGCQQWLSRFAGGPNKSRTSLCPRTPVRSRRYLPRRSGRCSTTTPKPCRAGCSPQCSSRPSSLTSRRAGSPWTSAAVPVASPHRWAALRARTGSP